MQQSLMINLGRHLHTQIQRLHMLAGTLLQVNAQSMTMAWQQGLLAVWHSCKGTDYNNLQVFQLMLGTY